MYWRREEIQGFFPFGFAQGRVLRSERRSEHRRLNRRLPGTFTLRERSPALFLPLQTAARGPAPAARCPRSSTRIKTPHTQPAPSRHYLRPRCFEPCRITQSLTSVAPAKPRHTLHARRRSRLRASTPRPPFLRQAE